MFKRKILFFFSLFSFNISIAQSARLGVYNPAPRVGDIITLDFTIVPDTLNTIGNINSVTGLNNIHNGEGSIKIKKLLSKEGKHTIGPFSFTFDDKRYTSNSIEIYVDSRLPDVREGLWFRQVKWNNNDYLIFEQRIDLSKKSNRNSKYPFNNFADLADNLWDMPGIISFQSISSTSPVQPTEENQQIVTLANKPVIYKISIYRINKGKDFKSFILTKNNVNNYDSDIPFQDFIIR